VFYGPAGLPSGIWELTGPDDHARGWHLSGEREVVFLHRHFNLWGLKGRKKEEGEKERRRPNKKES